MCLAQLSALSACAKALSEPEDEVLDLDGLAEATDEAAKAKSVSTDPRVQQLRAHLLEGIRALSNVYANDAEIRQALADLLKACTDTNISTPLSLDATELFEHTSFLLERELDAIWLSASGLLLFRQAKHADLPPASQHRLQGGMARILAPALTLLKAPGSE